MEGKRSTAELIGIPPLDCLNRAADRILVVLPDWLIRRHKVDRSDIGYWVNGGGGIQEYKACKENHP
jgi:hypothetical protein